MSENGEMTITEFLEARIVDDEYDAINSIHSWGGPFTIERMLADCAAKRAIIAEIPPKPEDPYTPSWHYAAAPILQHLAAVYADHPDYDPEWAL